MNRDELMRILTHPSGAEPESVEKTCTALLEFLGSLARNGQLKDISEAYCTLSNYNELYKKYFYDLIPLLLTTDYPALAGSGGFSDFAEWSVANPGWMTLVAQALPQAAEFEEQVDSVVRSVSHWAEQRRAGS
jgi:hypothetical protein